MTTFHESQPQSRRAARQSEREEGSDQAEFTDQQLDATQVHSPDNEPGDHWSGSPSAAERDATDSSSPKGRRAAAPGGPPSPAAEPLEYRTQQKSSVPTYNGPSFTNRAPQSDQLAESDPSTHAQDSHEFPPTQAVPQADLPAYRVRDYSPEGRRSAPIPPANWLTPPASQAASDAADRVDDAPTVTPIRSLGVDAASASTQRTQFYVPESALHDTIVPAISPASVVEPTAEADLPDAEPVAPVNEYTITRRELRALEAQQAAAAHKVPQLPEFSADGLLTGAAAAVFIETGFGDDDEDVDNVEPRAEGSDPAPALAEPFVLLEQLVPIDERVPEGSLEEVAADDDAAVDEVPVMAPALTPFDALFQVPPAEAKVAPANLMPPVAEAPATDVTPPADVQSDPVPLVEPPVSATAPPAADGPDLTDALAEFDSLTRESVENVVSQVEPEGVPVTVTESNWIPPIGHWSAQGEVDEDEPAEGSISRTIGSGISTTTALVLPSVPEGADIRGPLTSAGQIMLTGSIDLPRTLSSTGQSDRFDGESMDALFDLSDAEVISTDSSPVRAIRAVSTHTSGHGVTHTQKPKGTRALTGLLIAASSLAVVVAGLLVAAFAFNVF